MSMRDQETPEFSFSLRGYDRVQVDEYVAELLAYVIEVEERAATAESALVECRRELASPGSAGISERLAAILALANEEADQIRVHAQAEGAAMTQQAAERGGTHRRRCPSAARRGPGGDRRPHRHSRGAVSAAGRARQRDP